MHRELHEPPLHCAGSQLVPTMLVTHEPLPSQICPLATLPLHTLAPHDTPAGELATPAHDDVVVPSHAGAAHGFEPAGHAAREPCGCPLTGTHVPCAPVASHAWHSPVHAELQQNPSTHSLLLHALACVHEVPLLCFGTHTPTLHQASTAQSESCVQPLVHDALTHLYGSQLVPAICTQLPLPSHCWLSMLSPTQSGAPHTVPAGVLCAPLHDVRVTPSHCGIAHAVPVGQPVRDPCGAPTTATHVPCDIDTSHASHSPVHAAEQQKPSAQKPLVHAVAFVHDAPFPCRFAHTPPLQ
jgi:hypothetical protein